MAARILVVDDEPELVTILRDNLEIEGYEVLSAHTGEDALEIALREQPDLILLDIILPTLSGYDVCRRIRADGLKLPIIMLTARSAPMDKTAGLDIGADDYIGKPFDIGELLARIRAHLRRVGYADSWAQPRVVELGDVTIDLRGREIIRGSNHIQLSPHEFDLLSYLIEHRGEVVTREQVLSDVWGYDPHAVTRTVDNTIFKLRKHLEEDAGNPLHILTVHGAGYKVNI